MTVMIILRDLSNFHIFKVKYIHSLYKVQRIYVLILVILVPIDGSELFCTCTFPATVMAKLSFWLCIGLWQMFCVFKGMLVYDVAQTSVHKDDYTETGLGLYDSRMVVPNSWMKTWCLATANQWAIVNLVRQIAKLVLNSHEHALLAQQSTFCVEFTMCSFFISGRLKSTNI